jgi:predicted phage baseplate assembly protein
VQSDEGFGIRDLTPQNLEAEGAFQPFGPAAARDAALLLGFGEELPEATIRLRVWTPIPQQGRPAATCFARTPVLVSARLAWEVWNGAEWQALTLLKDDSGAFTRDGDILLNGPPPGRMVPLALGAVAEPRYWLRARIDSAGYEQAPELLLIRTNTIAATQAETLEFETLGGSNGEADQRLRLRDAPVLAGSLVLELDEGMGWQPWTEVPDFFGSGPDDAHYVLNRGTGEVRFGDGEAGRVPVANARNPANVRARSYRVGGGRRGNVAAGALSGLQSSVRGLDATAVTNPFGASGGGDEESVDAAIKRAPQALKTRERAVTGGDFEELAMRAANIARAKALPLHHPEFPGLEVPGVVSVIVVPDIDGPAPQPAAGTLATVCAYLDERRLLTTEVHVLGPTYRTVRVIAELVAEDSADLAEVKQAALDNLHLYFHPLTGGEDSDPDRPADDPERAGTGWPFGGDIYWSLLYRRLLRPGVRRVAALTIEVDGETCPVCSDVPLPDGLLLQSGEHDIRVDYEVRP